MLPSRWKATYICHSRKKWERKRERERGGNRSSSERSAKKNYGRRGRDKKEKIKIRVVSIRFYPSCEAVTRVLCVYLSLSPLSSRLTTNMYRAGGSVYAFARGLWTVSGPCRLEVAFSFNPFVSASRSFLQQQRFATTGLKKSFLRNLFGCNQTYRNLWTNFLDGSLIFSLFFLFFFFTIGNLRKLNLIFITGNYRIKVLCA